MKIRIFPVNHENCLHMAVRPEIYDAAFPGMMKLVPRAWWDRDKRVWLEPREAGVYLQCGFTWPASRAIHKRYTRKRISKGAMRVLGYSFSGV